MLTFDRHQLLEQAIRAELERQSAANGVVVERGECGWVRVDGFIEVSDLAHAIAPMLSPSLFHRLLAKVRAAFMRREP